MKLVKCTACGHEYDSEQHKSCPECQAKADDTQRIPVDPDRLNKALEGIDTLVEEVKGLKTENEELRKAMSHLPKKNVPHFSGGEPAAMDTQGETLKDTFQKLKALHQGKTDGGPVKIRAAHMYHKEVYGKSKGLTSWDFDQMGGLIEPERLPMAPVPGFGKIGEKIMQHSRVDFSGTFASQDVVDLKNVGSASIYGGIKFTMVSELSGVGSQDEPKIDQIHLKGSEGQGETLISKKLIDGAPNAEAVVVDMFRKGFEYFVGYKALNGSGTKEPLGWKTAASTMKIPRNTASTIKLVDLRSMRGRLFAQDPTALFWFISWSAWETVSGIEDTSGRPIFFQDYTKALPPTVMNIPVIWTYESPYIGVEADASLVDCSAYAMGFGRDLTVFASEHRYAEKRAVYYIFHFDIDGRPRVLDVIRLTDQSAASGDDSSGFRISPQVILTDAAA